MSNEKDSVGFKLTEHQERMIHGLMLVFHNDEEFEHFMSGNSRKEVPTENDSN